MRPCSVLCCLGDLVEDVTIYVHTPLAFGSDTAAIIIRRQGGSAANVAKHAASLNTPTTFVGQVGSDNLGQSLVDGLMAQGVTVWAPRRGRTGSIVVIVDRDGERSFLTDRGAASQLETVMAEWLTGVQCLHVPWYSLAAGPIAEATQSAIETVRNAGAGVSIDVSSVALFPDVAEGRNRIERLAPDIVFANAAEAVHLNLLSEPLTACRLIVIKRGAESAVLLDRRGRMTHVDALSLTLSRLDTTGAGDAFAAGFLTATLCGESDIASARAGHEAAHAHLTDQHLAFDNKIHRAVANASDPEQTETTAQF